MRHSLRSHHFKATSIKYDVWHISICLHFPAALLFLYVIGAEKGYTLASSLLVSSLLEMHFRNWDLLRDEIQNEIHFPDTGRRTEERGDEETPQRGMRAALCVSLSVDLWPLTCCCCVWGLTAKVLLGLGVGGDGLCGDLDCDPAERKTTTHDKLYS